MKGFVIIRCDRLDRIGGGVCIYLRDSICFEIYLSYSNSVCELLIVKLSNPDLIIVLLYRPPSCTVTEFTVTMGKLYDCISNLASPLPNIMLLGEFNLLFMDWSNPVPKCMTSYENKLT